MILNQTIVRDVARLHLDFILCDDSLQRPRSPSQRSYLCLGRVPACESRSLLHGGAFHSLCGGLALS